MMLNDQTLMGYADGLLGSYGMERVGQLLANDPELRANLRIFRFTGRRLASLLEPHLNAPVPAKLREALTTEKSKLVSWCGANSYRQLTRHRLRDWGRTLTSPKVGYLNLVCATSVAVAGGIALGWLIRGASADSATVVGQLVQIESNRLVAQGRLQQMLETLPHGEPILLAGSSRWALEIKIKMTFYNEEGDYCRWYEVAAKSARHAGVACRVDGRWFVKLQALIPPPPSAAARTIPAGNSQNSAMDAVIGALIAGDPVTDKEEADAMSRGWKP
jgi:hypothetical protein